MLIPLLAFPSTTAIAHDASSAAASPADSPKPFSAEFLEQAKSLCIANTGIFVQLPVGEALPEAAAVKPLLRATKSQVGPFTLSQASLAGGYLDAGAIRVLFDAGSAASWSSPSSAEAREDFLAVLSTLPKARVGVILSASSASAFEDVTDEAVSSIASVASALFIRCPEGAVSFDVARLKAVHKKLGAEAFLALITTAEAVNEETVGALHLGADCHVATAAFIAPSAAASAESPASPAGALEVGTCFASCAKTDREDKLYTTVVTDECGKALGLVYSSKESLTEAVRCRRGVYYSRSRGGLWRKGDTSGAYQELLCVALDCDSDAVMFSVRQRGDPAAFCHLNCRTCWGEDQGLTALQRVLESRKASAPAGSYTKRLFDDGALLKNKLLEEAQELSEALEEGGDIDIQRDHVAAEAADLIYFALVAATKAGVSIADIEAHLDARALKITRRPGNAKAERIAAAEAHFAAVGAGAGKK